MDDSKAAAAKDGNKKTSRASVQKATKKTIDMAAMLEAAMQESIAAPGSRLIVDMPLKGKGDVRLVLSDSGRRISAWGTNMDEAVAKLLAKATD